MRIELLAAEQDAGRRLDVFLAAHPEIGSRAQAQRLINASAVTVGGVERPKNWRLATGDRILIELPEPTPARAESASFEIVFQDDHLLVVDKPAGVVVHPARGHDGPTLAEALAGLAAGGPDPARAGIVHRLDRDTSGLLVVSRSERVHTDLQRMIRARELTRQYLALVSGSLDADSGTIDAPLGRDRARRALVSIRTDRARSAVTHFEVVERFPRTTLLQARLETGRTHQIRAHFQAIDHPVCGDRSYGGRECGKRLGLDRHFLHSNLVMFRHPVTGEHVVCESKPPAELQRALDVAKREPVSGGPDGG